MSMFIRRLSCLSSFTRAMFTHRKIFSSSFAISAARVELTGTTRATTCVYSACAARPLGGFFQLLESTCLGEVRVFQELLDFVLRNVLDLGLPRVDYRQFLGINIKTRDFVPCFGEAQRQRRMDVTAANDPNLELGAFEKF